MPLYTWAKHVPTQVPKQVSIDMSILTLRAHVLAHVYTCLTPVHAYVHMQVDILTVERHAVRETAGTIGNTDGVHR